MLPPQDLHMHVPPLRDRDLKAGTIQALGPLASLSLS